MPRAPRRHLAVGQIWQDKDSRVTSRLVEIVALPDDQYDGNSHLFVRRGIYEPRATRETRLLVRNLRTRYTFVADTIAEVPRLIDGA